MKYEPKDGRWIALNSSGLKEIRKLFSPEEYELSKKALKTYLCSYFSTGNCTTEQGSAISPIGLTPDGGKKLKVRWGIPGKGKSGSLRLIVVAYCDRKEVNIADVSMRADL